MGAHIRCKHYQYKCEYTPESMADYRTDDELMCSFHRIIDSFLDRLDCRKVWWLWIATRRARRDDIERHDQKDLQ